MRISDVTLPASASLLGDPDRQISGVNHDSRVTRAGDLYAALPGANVHGASFVKDLVAAGVRAVLTDQRGIELIRAAGVDTSQLTLMVVENPRAHLGAIAAQVYGTRDGDLRLFGVTGTNGKTTTTYLLDALLRALGERTGLIGTVATVIAGDRVDSVRTTPEAPELHQLFARMRTAGVTSCSMEVSSHALSQHRVDGAHFTVAGFTNLSQDHLDFHHTMEEYFAAKAKLFTPEFAGRGVVVLADDWARKLADTAAIPIRTLSMDPADAPDYLCATSGDRWVLRTPAGELAFTPPLAGTFNVTNTALALAMLLEAGCPIEKLAQVAQTFEITVPGRMEMVSDDAPRVIVDYSHTPDAIEHVLESVDGDPLIIVVGAGGERDAGKRPLMGAAAANGADLVIVTDDNPRSEDPNAIRAAVLDGAQKAAAAGTARAESIEEIGDRAAAIRRAVGLAGAAGTVVIAGKGHETGQEILGVKHHFDDREHARNAVQELKDQPARGKVQD